MDRLIARTVRGGLPLSVHFDLTYRGDKRIDLDPPRQLALGLMVSQLSRQSAYWYRIARTAAVATLAVRKFLGLGGASKPGFQVN